MACRSLYISLQTRRRHIRTHLVVLSALQHLRFSELFSQLDLLHNGSLLVGDLLPEQFVSFAGAKPEANLGVYFLEALVEEVLLHIPPLSLLIGINDLQEHHRRLSHTIHHKPQAE
jgi:hypothetical protein